MQRTPNMDWEDVKRLFVRWSEQYCLLLHYWRFEGRPVCSVLNLTDFVFHYGLANFGLMLLYARRVMQESLGAEPYFIGVVSEANSRNAFIANHLPLDAATGYALLPDWRGPMIQQYDELIERRVREWYALQDRLGIPFFPVASAGWDASVRGERLDRITGRSGFPWTPIVVGVTPERFGYFLDQAIEFNRRRHPEANIVFIHAWNEWTESSVVEPSDRFGTSLLEEVRKRSGTFQVAGGIEEDAAHYGHGLERRPR